MRILVALFAITLLSGSIAAVAAIAQGDRLAVEPRPVIVAQTTQAVPAPKPIRIILASPY